MISNPSKPLNSLFITSGNSSSHWNASSSMDSTNRARRKCLPNKISGGAGTECCVYVTRSAFPARCCPWKREPVSKIIDFPVHRAAKLTEFELFERHYRNEIMRVMCLPAELIGGEKGDRSPFKPRAVTVQTGQTWKWKPTNLSKPQGESQSIMTWSGWTASRWARLGTCPVAGVPFTICRCLSVAVGMRWLLRVRRLLSSVLDSCDSAYPYSNPGCGLGQSYR